MVQKSKLVTFILSWFLGYFGIHRFYTGKVWTGILYLLTGGLWGVGVFFDNLFILMNCYKDKEGNLEEKELKTSWKQRIFIIIIVFMLFPSSIYINTFPNITIIINDICYFINPTFSFHIYSMHLYLSY